MRKIEADLEKAREAREAKRAEASKQAKAGAEAVKEVKEETPGAGPEVQPGKEEKPPKSDTFVEEIRKRIQGESGGVPKGPAALGIAYILASMLEDRRKEKKEKSVDGADALSGMGALLALGAVAAGGGEGPEPRASLIKTMKDTARMMKAPTESGVPYASSWHVFSRGIKIITKAEGFGDALEAVAGTLSEKGAKALRDAFSPVLAGGEVDPVNFSRVSDRALEELFTHNAQIARRFDRVLGALQEEAKRLRVTVEKRAAGSIESKPQRRLPYSLGELLSFHPAAKVTDHEIRSIEALVGKCHPRTL
jgi:hypothetical protein